MTAKEMIIFMCVHWLSILQGRPWITEDIVKAIGEEGIKKLLHDAEMDHCLSFEQVSDKISEFNTDLYYQNPDYLEWSYRDGKLLD